jgi:predicted phosphohydrolase
MQQSIQICSDIHLDYPDFNEDSNNFIKIINPSADILIIAGDLGNPYHQNYYNFLLYYSQLFIKIIIIAGNHEYYYNDIFQTNLKIEEICNKFNNVYFLNNSSIEIDGILFIGTTLWSNVPIDIDANQISKINDYIKIKNFSPVISNRLFKENVDFITNELKRNKKTIVITHHAPSYNCIPAEFKKDILNYCFYSHLDYLLQKSNIVKWIYGHTHHNYNENKMISNCYRGVDYKNNLCITI